MSGTRKLGLSDTVAQTGVNAVEAIFLKMRWLFRRQLESDYGIDAHVETRDQEGNPSGQLVAIQIKSGSSFFRRRGEDYVFYGEQRHLDYWDKHCLPVLLVLHNPENGVTLWQRIERHLVAETEDGAWSISIPKWRTLTAEAERAILDSIPRSDAESDRRNRMTLDAALIRRVGEEGTAFVTVDEWVNKSLNFRAASIAFGEHNASVAYAAEFYMRAANPSRVFDWLFPWLEFAYLDMPRDDNGEVMAHVFEVKLNALGNAFLLLDSYYSNGAEASPEAELDEPTGEIWNEEEVAQFQFAKAQQGDWEAEAQGRSEDERQ